MFGLAKSTDLTFLLHTRLERIRAGNNLVKLYFSDSICIHIEGDWEVNQQANALSMLEQAVDCQIVDVTVLDGGTLSILFSNGTRLCIFDSNSHYESYNINTPTGVIVV